MININWNITEKIKAQIEIIEALSNATGDINIEWDIDEETLNNIILQLVLTKSIKESIQDWKDGKDWVDGKDGLDGKNWLKWEDWLNWTDWINGINWLNGKDWLKGKDWINGIDWEDWESLEFNWKGTSLWIKKEWEEKYEYRDLIGKGYWLWMWAWLIAVDNVSNTKTITKDFTVTVQQHKIICDATNNDITISLPNASWIENKEFIITRLDNSLNTVTVQPSWSQTLYWASSEYLKQYETLEFSSNNLNYL